MKIKSLNVLLASLLCISLPAFAQNASLKQTKGFQKLPGKGLSASDVFKRVSPSIVVISSLDEKLNPIASGSGVVTSFSSPARNRAFTRNGALNTLIATNCHVVNKGVSDVVKVQRGEDSGLGVVVGKDEGRDLCIVAAAVLDYRNGAPIKGKDGYSVSLKLPAVQISFTRGLQVGDQVYAIGAPKGLELTLSNGIVSGFRKYAGSQIIQTTAPISRGSSGGGLFDIHGRLVGITTMYLDDGQNLNFAVPAQLIASVPEAKSGNVQPAVRPPEPMPSPQGSEWLLIGTRSDGIRLYVDTQTIKRDGSNVTVWQSTRLPVAQPFPGTTPLVDEYRIKSTFLCASRQEIMLIFSTWLRGALVYQGSDKTPKTTMDISSAPGTNNERFYKAVCGQ